jgi:hypothetical protein
MKFVYVSHPFGGKEENREKADRLIHNLVCSLPDVVYLSPIHAMRRPYHEKGTVGYDWELQCAMELMRRCDIVYFADGWQHSTGCRMERQMARMKRIPCVEDLESLEKQIRNIDEIKMKIRHSENIFVEVDKLFGYGSADVLCERAKQLLKYGKAYDQQWVEAAQLIHAAMCYANAAQEVSPGKATLPLDWPWKETDWHPEETQRSNLVKAAALLIAEIDRIDEEGKAHE